MGLYNHIRYANRSLGISEGLYDRCCVKKGADQLRGYPRLCFLIYTEGRFPHDEATMTMHDFLERLKLDMLPVALLPVFWPHHN